MSNVQGYLRTILRTEQSVPQKKLAKAIEGMLHKIIGTAFDLKVVLWVLKCRDSIEADCEKQVSRTRRAIGFLEVEENSLTCKKTGKASMEQRHLLNQSL